MIETLRGSGVRDLTVLQAFDRVPRHLFVPERFAARAYMDEALPIGHGQTISRPSTHALFLEALELEGHERVLEIGTGSGYQTALLASLADHVLSIERVAELAASARDRIEALGFTNVLVRVGDGALGWRAYSPFDAIVVTAAARDTPGALIEQLGPGGRLLVPLGTGDAQELHRLVRDASGEVSDEVIGDARFVALQEEPAPDSEGRQGW